MHCLSWQDAEKETPKTRQRTITDFAHGATWRVPINNSSVVCVGICHRSVLNILDSLLANQIPAKGVVTIVCRIEIRKMAEC